MSSGNLQYEIIIQEYRLWDYRRNGIRGKVIDEIDDYIQYLKSLQMNGGSVAATQCVEDAK
jgi:hypothetical protein